MQPERLVFLHIPKTAGTSLQTVIKRNYRERERYTLNAIRWPEKLETFEGKDKSKVKILTGHVPFGAHESFGKGTFEYFTLLREPVERTISHYNQILRTPHHHFAEEMREKKYSLKELMESGRLLFVDNLQVRMLSGELRIPYGTVNEETLQKALFNIEKHFPVIGLQKQFDVFLLQLCERYHWKYPWYRKNQVSKKSTNTAELDTATFEAVKKYNEMDLRLYETISKKLEPVFRDEQSDFMKRVKKFQKTNTRLAAFVNAIPFFPAPRGD